jgi:hypothetical protein
MVDNRSTLGLWPGSLPPASSHKLRGPCSLRGPRCDLHGTVTIRASLIPTNQPRSRVTEHANEYSTSERGGVVVLTSFFGRPTRIIRLTLSSSSRADGSTTTDLLRSLSTTMMPRRDRLPCSRATNIYDLRELKIVGGIALLLAPVAFGASLVVAAPARPCDGRVSSDSQHPTFVRFKALIHPITEAAIRCAGWNRLTQGCLRCWRAARSRKQLPKSWEAPTQAEIEAIAARVPGAWRD